jgi:LDH2 family malate/lactate/ureidoglycolate dehydrogenase
MATSVVPMGKIDVYSREGKKLPDGWALDETGVPSNDSTRVLKNLAGHSITGGIFPLGGEGELHGGHKGYGLAMLVDILSGILSDANYGRDVTFIKDGKVTFPNIGHFFLALDLSFFLELDEFTENMDDAVSRLQNSKKRQGMDRIFVHGEKESEESKQRTKHGIPLDEITVTNLKKYEDEFGVPLKLVGD